jgi:hypothetical protein
VPNKITKLMNKNKMEAVVAWYHERQDSVDATDDSEIDGDAPKEELPCRLRNRSAAIKFLL